MPQLPDRPDLDQLRRQARELHRAAQGGDAAALRRLRHVSDKVTLSTAQLALAREYGFPSWRRLRDEVERRRAVPGRRDVLTVRTPTPTAEADELIAGQYADRPALRPVLDAVLAALSALGPVTVQARKTSCRLVSPRRTFAAVQATTKSRVDLGLRLDGVARPAAACSRPGTSPAARSISASRWPVPARSTRRCVGWLRRAYDESVAPPAPRRPARRPAPVLGTLTVLIDGFDLPGLTCHPEPDGTVHRSVHVALTGRDDGPARPGAARPRRRAGPRAGARRRPVGPLGAPGDRPPRRRRPRLRRPVRARGSRRPPPRPGLGRRTRRRHVAALPRGQAPPRRCRAGRDRGGHAAGSPARRPDPPDGCQGQPGLRPGAPPGPDLVGAEMRVTSRNARFQQWAALLDNRAKRQRSGEFIVQGVRPITLALRNGWPIRDLLYNADVEASRWARETLDAVAATKIAVSAELMRELGEKDEGPPELLAVAELPADDLARIPVGPAHARCRRRPAGQPGEPGHADPVGGRVRGVRGDRHRSRGRRLRPPVRAGQHRLAVLPAGGPGRVAPAGAGLGRGDPGRRESASAWSAPTSTAGWTSPGSTSPGRRCCWSATRRPGSARPGARRATSWPGSRCWARPAR